MPGYDPTYYAGSAPHYRRGRPAYSAELNAVLERELGLDGSGCLLDVGCGPGTLTVPLADSFAEVIGLDPDPAMLVEALQHARDHDTSGITWVQARAEEIPDLALAPVRVATFGQSFHWTDRQRVAEAVYALLVPGGAIVLISHEVAGRPVPDGPGAPPIPHDEIKAVVRRHDGPHQRAGQGVWMPEPDRHEDVLARTPFTRPRHLWAPGRADLVRSTDEVISGLFSMSFAAPHLFGDRLDEFVDELQELLTSVSPSGMFWDWPGDTAVIVATKPSSCDHRSPTVPVDVP